MKKMIITAAKGLNSRERAKLAKTSTDERQLRQLAYDNSVAVRRAVASNPYTPVKVLDYLSNDEDEEVRGNVASNNNASEQSLRKLADEFDWYVGGNENTPPDVLDELAHSGDSWTKNIVAKNPHASSDTLDYLSYDTERYTRGSVASNPSTSESTLIKLSEDSDILIRSDVARNPNTPDDILEKMVVEDSYNYAARNALLNLGVSREDLLPSLFDRPDGFWMSGDILEYVKNASSDIIEEIFDKIHGKEISCDVISAIFENPNISNYMAEYLADIILEKANKYYPSYKDLRYFKVLADNPKTPQDVLDKIGHHRSYKVRELVSEENRNSKSKSTSSDWSISPYEVDNYSVLSNEIDQLVEQAVRGLINTYFEGSYGTYEKDGNYDDGGTLKVIVDGKDVVELDLEDVAALVTSQQKKQKGVKALLNKMASQVM